MPRDTVTEQSLFAEPAEVQEKGQPDVLLKMEAISNKIEVIR